MKKIIELIDNKIQFGNYDSYCAILGESPSKGARSPILWNACFQEFGISSYFYPFDVSPDNLGKVVECLKMDANFNYKAYFFGSWATPDKPFQFLIFLWKKIQLGLGVFFL